jgi:hypothetical protein
VGALRDRQPRRAGIAADDPVEVGKAVIIRGLVNQVT